MFCKYCDDLITSEFGCEKDECIEAYEEELLWYERIDA